MMASTPWQDLLATPAAGQHIAQLYTQREFLARAVGRWVGDGLRQGEAVVVIATPLHWRATLRELDARHLRVESFQRRGQLVVQDAEETLGTFMVNDIPDRVRFRDVIGRMIDDAHANGFRTVRGFGEMVDILRRTNLTATFRLEGLWNELLIERGIALLCGYSLDTFDPKIYRGLLQQVSGSHSDLIPVEDYARLELAVDRAYEEVFGGGTDAGDLRRAFLQHYARPAAMPDAEAALMAVREFVPSTSDALLESVRRYYIHGGLGAPPKPPTPPGGREVRPPATC
jgi:hypothetical protein